MSEIRKFLKEAGHVKPTQRQLDWLDIGFYGFIHFGVNTFTNREWGLGDEDPAIFDPTELDCDQWVAAAKSAGMKGLILTAKHHDGFCLWPSKFTEHSVKNSPFRGGKGDVVREFAEACRRGGIKFGFYLSPWDRNSKLYGTDAYNDYYKAQLTELLTGYGDVFMVWFDSACGEGPNGKKQEYDFEGYIELVRKYQPGACIFNDFGPDVRWIGNESGTARFAEWAVMPKELTTRCEVQTGPAPMYAQGALDHIYNTQPELGSISNILTSGGLCFCPAETDMSIRKGWFWHPDEEPHSLERLKRTYLTSTGGNSALNLNIPPDKRGLIDERDVHRLKEFGEWLNKSFGITIDYAMSVSGPAERPVYELKLTEKQKIGYIELREAIENGQRVETFLVNTKNDDGTWNSGRYHGTTIGSRRLIELNCETDTIQIQVTFARCNVEMKEIKVYKGE